MRHRKERSHGPNQATAQPPSTKGATKRRQRSKLKVAVLTFIALVIILVGVIIPAVGSYLVLYGSRYRPYDRLPHHIGLPEPKIVNFPSPGATSANAVKLTAWWLPSARERQPTPTQWNSHILRLYNATNTNATIIVVHGHGSNMGRVMGTDDGVLFKAMLPFHTAGYNVFAIDLRNHGESSESLPVTLGLYESDDVLAAADWLIANADTLGIDATRLAVWGESMGGSTSLLAAEKDRHTRRFKAVVADSGYTNATKAISWRGEYQYGLPRPLIYLFWVYWQLLSPWDVNVVDAMRAITNIEVPVMVVHGRSDPVVAFADGVDLYEAAMRTHKQHGRPPRVEKFWHDGGHVKAFRVENHYDVLIDFFEDHV